MLKRILSALLAALLLLAAIPATALAQVQELPAEEAGAA